MTKEAGVVCLTSLQWLIELYVTGIFSENVLQYSGQTI